MISGSGRRAIGAKISVFTDIHSGLRGVIIPVGNGGHNIFGCHNANCSLLKISAGNNEWCTRFFSVPFIEVISKKNSGR